MLWTLPSIKIKTNFKTIFIVIVIDVVLDDPIMTHFYPDGSSLLQNESVPIHGAQGVTECFDEYDNDVNHMV